MQHRKVAPPLLALAAAALIALSAGNALADDSSIAPAPTAPSASLAPIYTADDSNWGG